MSQIIPLVTSGIAGPLGVLHLPRLWQKASLDAVGKLHSDYPAAGAGFDQMTLDALGIERDAFLAYIKESKPSYTQCEQWILDQKGGSLNSSAIDTHNAAVVGYNHDDATRGGILSAVSIADTGAILDAVNLNNLEDWQDFYNQQIAG
ncbi:MAG: DUF5069 domain-containing protein [Akkermansiaceae bacterium]|nr:DUF5069 domain-containing protein [Akkermansiaceae bacterium]|tara:strand:- start:3129 stop:3572 length:444 start_codon:yes stop_codon:yes gene_type:complete